jgi:hypothetical protein
LLTLRGKVDPMLSNKVRDAITNCAFDCTIGCGDDSDFQPGFVAKLKPYLARVTEREDRDPMYAEIRFFMEEWNKCLQYMAQP